MEQIQSWMLPLLVIGIVVQFFWSSVMSLFLYRLTHSDRGIEILQKQLNDTAEKLVAERFRAVTHDVNNHVQHFKATLDSLSEKMRESEREFMEMQASNPNLELRLWKEVNAQHNATCERLAQLERTVMTREDLKAVLREVRRDA